MKFFNIPKKKELKKDYVEPETKATLEKLDKIQKMLTENKRRRFHKFSNQHSPA